jgi:hypothetical protein
MLHVEERFKPKLNLNLESAVLSPFSKTKAIPLEATANSIFPSARTVANILSNRNDFQFQEVHRERTTYFPRYHFSLPA